MDSKYAEELKELDRKGLCKMSLKGAGAHDVTVIVNKNVPNSISYDFIQEELEVSTFLDHNKERPAECYLYKYSCIIPFRYLRDDEYEEKRQNEIEKMKSRTTLVTQKEP
ncbi:MAG: hypothetical protein JRD93_22350 [Deltaproteobacteria bacterium]|nr:hypothetical protein [Deltaproteobacteria bacterium]